MDCECIVYLDDCETCEFHDSKIVTAKKEHKCTECGRIISAGEKYERVSGLWGGYFSQYKTCEDCMSIRTEFFPGGYAYSFIFEDLIQCFQDCGGTVSEEKILKLTPRAKDKVLEIIQGVVDMENE